MKKIKSISRKIVVLAVCLSMLAGMFQMWSLDTRNVNAANKLANPRINDSVSTWDCIYFGNYFKSNSITQEPIKWRVLSVEGDDVLIYADQILDCKRYDKYAQYDEYGNKIPSTCVWKKCALRKWLNHDFFNTAFNSSEKKAIKEFTDINKNSKENDKVTDKVFILSKEEISDIKYGFNSDIEKASVTRECTPTSYAKKRGVCIRGSYTYADNGWYLLRNNYNSKWEDYEVANINYKGRSNKDGVGDLPEEICYGIRPAVKISLSKAKWEYAGTVSANIGGRIAKAKISKKDHSINKIKNPRVTDTASVWDSIYFGNYYQTNDSEKEPIKWRVLSVNGKKALILAEQGMVSTNFYETRFDCAWKDSSLRKWMNSKFLNELFTSSEINAIQDTNLKDENTVDKMFLLSKDDIINKSYGFNYIDKKIEGMGIRPNQKNKATGFCMLTDYATSYLRRVDSGESEWCLRTLNGGYPIIVNTGGAFNSTNNSVYAIRPALYIDLSSTEWSYAGTITADETSDHNYRYYTIKESERKNTVSKVDYKIKKPRVKRKYTAAYKTTWDCIYFGKYYQNDLNGKKKEPIKWRVLSIVGDNALVISDKVLDRSSYNYEYKDITWEKCYLRKWLNGTFYKTAFNSKEQKAIRPSKVVNDYYNEDYGTYAGKDTIDNIFVLSCQEACEEKYGFTTGLDHSTDTRLAKPTKYEYEDSDLGSDTTETWWLRSPGDNEKNVLYVGDYSGNIERHGEKCGSWVKTDKDTSIGVGNKVEMGIRPVLYVNLASSVWKKAGTVSATMSKKRMDYIDKSIQFGPGIITELNAKLKDKVKVVVDWKDHLLHGKVKNTKIKYEVQYSQRNDFKKINGNKIITKITSKKQIVFPANPYGMHVRVRGFIYYADKVVKFVKYDNRKVYGNWSESKIPH